METIDNDEQEQSATASTTDESRNNRKPIAVIIAIIVVVLIIGIAIAASSCSQSTQDSSTNSVSKSESTSTGNTTSGGTGSSNKSSGSTSGSSNSSSNSSSNKSSNNSSKNSSSVNLRYLVITDENCVYDESTGYAKTSAVVKNTSSSVTFTYVKVRQRFYSPGSNTVIDTDWTYAVDGDGLRPGESKRFELMSKQPSINFQFRLDVTEANMQ